jgi:hypothetical protein
MNSRQRSLVSWIHTMPRSSPQPVPSPIHRVITQTCSSPHSCTTSLPTRSKWLIAALLLANWGCEAAVGGLVARASDQWTHTYALTEKGQIQISSGNGDIEIEGVNGSMVEVQAERVVRAATETAARDLLPRISIKEEITPDRIVVETERLPGVIIGVDFKVNYHVRVPRSALVRARTTNGMVSVEGINGRVFANTTNGGVNGRELGGGVDARATNGRVAIELREVGDDPIDVRTTNGSAQVTLPANAKANLSVSTVNGAIDVSSVGLEPMGEQSKRRQRGRINGGGTPIEVTTVNGGVMITTR